MYEQFVLLFTLTLQLFLSFSLFSQPTDSLQIKTIEDQLVEYAIDNSINGIILKKESEVIHQQAQLSRWSWLENITASFNANEYTIGESELIEDNNLFFPKYNLRVNLRLGQLYSVPKNTQILNTQHQISQLQLDQFKKSLRTEVLSKYYTYNLAVELLEIFIEEYEDSYTNYLLFSEKFKNGEASLNEYSQSLIIYNQSRAKKANQESEIKLARLQLEDLLGTYLENILE